jgi:formylmethanofuran dehydrogenase subunit E
MWTDDAVADAERYTYEQDKKLDKLPVCEYCNNPIQDDYYYDINGEVMCEDCLDTFYRKLNDN